MQSLRRTRLKKNSFVEYFLRYPSKFIPLIIKDGYRKNENCLKFKWKRPDLCSLGNIYVQWCMKHHHGKCAYDVEDIDKYHMCMYGRLSRFLLRLSTKLQNSGSIFHVILQVSERPLIMPLLRFLGWEEIVYGKHSWLSKVAWRHFIGRLSFQRCWQSRPLSPFLWLMASFLRTLQQNRIALWCMSKMIEH